jgi:hypothetical protein
VDKSNSSNKLYIEEDEISVKELVQKLKDWWKFILSKIIIILITGFLGGLVGILTVYFQKPVYTAELTFVLEGAQSGGGQMAGYSGLASQFGLDMGGGGQGVFEGENFLALMKSRLMTEKALLTTVEVDNKKITLAEFYIDIYEWREKWKEKKSVLAGVRIPPDLNPSSFSRLQNSIITSIYKTVLAKNLVVDKKDKKSGIISLKVESVDELFSMYFSEVLAKEVSTFYIETKTKKSAENLAILQFQTDSIKQRLNFSMAGAATAIDENPNPNLAKLVLRVPSQRNQGEVQINQAILTQLVQNLEMAKMSLRTETPLIQVIDRPVLPLAKAAPDKLATFIKWTILIIILFTGFITVRRSLDNL